MRNAKQELLEAVKESKQTIICAEISRYSYDDINKPFILKENYTEDDYHKFLNELNFKYDGGYGVQNLYGTVWLSNNTWLERCEYDGSEWWEYKQVPSIPDLLKGK